MTREAARFFTLRKSMVESPGPSPHKNLMVHHFEKFLVDHSLTESCEVYMDYTVHFNHPSVRAGIRTPVANLLFALNMYHLVQYVYVDLHDMT